MNKILLLFFFFFNSLIQSLPLSHPSLPFHFFLSLFSLESRVWCGFDVGLMWWQMGFDVVEGMGDWWWWWLKWVCGVWWWWAEGNGYSGGWCGFAWLFFNEFVARFVGHGKGGWGEQRMVFVEVGVAWQIWVVAEVDFFMGSWWWSWRLSW